jgi:predicted ester cyclase
MATEENKNTFRRYVEEVSNKGKLDVVDEIFGRYVSHQPDGHTEERGPEDVKRFIGEFRQAFPDFHSTIEDQIAEGDKVVTRWRASGTHQGEFRGAAPTGNRITVTGTGIFRFSEEGKVVESWDSFDQLGLMQQLGVLPQPGSPVHEGGITPEEISGRSPSEPAPRGRITPEEISGGRQPDIAAHGVGVPPEDISGRRPPSSTPHTPRKGGIRPEDVSGD